MEAELINSGELAAIYMPKVQISSYFVPSFKFDEKLYPDAKNPNLDRYPVLVFEVGLNDGEKSYGFINVLAFYDDLFEQITEAQICLGMSYDDLANAVNLNPDDLYLWAVGYIELPDEKIQKIAEVLRLDWKNLKSLWNDIVKKIKGTE